MVKFNKEINWPHLAVWAAVAFVLGIIVYNIAKG